MRPVLLVLLTVELLLLIGRPIGLIQHRLLRLQRLIVSVLGVCDGHDHNGGDEGSDNNAKR